MVFSTLTFLFVFLPLTCILYYLLPFRGYRNTVLLAASILFYSWGEPKYILLMLAASLVAYIGGLLIFRLEKTGKLKLRKFVFVLTVSLLILNLLIFKYFNFAAENVSRLLNLQILVPEIVLPIGISFYTFQILSYVIDLYHHRVFLQKNYFHLTLYVTFFPQLIAGPIVRYQTVEEDIKHRRETVDDVVVGVKRFIVGLAKKVILANNVGAFATLIYGGDKAVYGTQFYWLATVAYALQIYFDFSGYSDMAIGLGRVFGFRFLENFNYPYIATSITDFWRRWHISLSSWFRDYIYIPLGGNRVKRSRWILNILIVWGLTGFWHGAQWNFLLWGCFYGVLLLIEKLFLQKMLHKIPKILRWCYTAFFVLIGWVLFNFTDFTQLTETLKHLFSFRFTPWISAVEEDISILYGLFYIPAGIVCMFPWKKPVAGSWISALAEDLIYGILFVVCVMYILGSTYNPFIYFRF